MQCPRAHPSSSGGCGLCDHEFEHRHLVHSTNMKYNNCPPNAQIENFVTYHCEFVKTVFDNRYISHQCHLHCRKSRCEIAERPLVRNPRLNFNVVAFLYHSNSAMYSGSLRCCSDRSVPRLSTLCMPLHTFLIFSVA